MNLWPDGTPKSGNNAFDWRNRTPEIEPTRLGPTPPRTKDLHAKSNVFQAYTRAGNPPPVAVPRSKRSAASPSTQT